jgi:hypothetical protein
VAAAISVMQRDDVLLQRMASGLRIVSSFPKISFFTARSSSTASMTTSTSESFRGGRRLEARRIFWSG